jgi:hypothetical protein
MDTISWFLATMHQAIGHDKTAAYIGAAPGDKNECILCWYEAGRLSRNDVEAWFDVAEKGVDTMTDQEREEWNAAVRAIAENPSPANIAERDRLREKFLTGVHQRVMTEDRYQDRTHD